MRSKFQYLGIDDFVRQVDRMAKTLIDASTPLFEVGTASEIPTQLKSFREEHPQRLPDNVNGTYIWRLSCTPDTFLSVWRRRVALYDQCDKKNRSDKSLEITSKPRGESKPNPLNFYLPVPNPHWLRLHNGQGAKKGEYVLYVGKRSGGEVFTRLEQHYSCVPGTSAMKLGGTAMPKLELTKTQERFLREFVEKDQRLVKSLKFDGLKCNVIFHEGQTEQTPVIEEILRSVLVPMLGKK